MVVFFTNHNVNYLCPSHSINGLRIEHKQIKMQEKEGTTVLSEDIVDQDPAIVKLSCSQDSREPKLSKVIFEISNLTLHEKY